MDGIYAIKATTAKVISPITRANLLTRKGSCLSANRAKAVFCVPFVATAINWKKPKAIATAAIETVGSGDLAIPALRIGCVPAGSNAANNRGAKNLAIDLIEGLLVSVVPLNLRNGCMATTINVAVSTRVPEVIAAAAILDPWRRSVVNKTMATITVVIAPAPVPIHANRGRLIRNTAPYKCILRTSKPGSGISHIRAFAAFSLRSPLTENTVVSSNSVVCGMATARAIPVTKITHIQTNFRSSFREVALSKNTKVSCWILNWGSETNIDIDNANPYPPIAASGFAVRVNIADSSGINAVTTVIFAAVGSSRDTACLVKG